MSGASEVTRLVSAASADGAEPAAVFRAVTRLLSLDPAAGVGVVLDLLSRPPRIKPSRGLLIDPTDAVRRAWDRRVAAAAALQRSPARGLVEAEVRAELADSPDLAADVRAVLAADPTEDPAAGAGQYIIRGSA